MNTTKEKAQAIQDKVFKGFPAIPKFEEDSKQMARDLGYVETLWGRKRRLPDMQLPRYEFDFSARAMNNFDPLDFDNNDTSEYYDYDLADKYTRLMDKAYGRQAKEQVKAKAREDGIIIKDNGGFIADAERQCVNARIQRFSGRYVKKSYVSCWQ